MKILLAGDSTVTDQIKKPNHNPAVCYCGWGKMLPKFLLPEYKVLNFAQSGLTVESFRNEGQYDKLNASFEKGDFVLIQFGHNDQKLAHLRAEGGYANGLQQYINEIKANNGTPVLVTSVARNTWLGEGAEYNDLLHEYSKAMKNVATINNVPCLDLNGATTAWIKSLGLHNAKRYFYPGDYTHPNDYGGYHWAFLLAQLIADSTHADILPLKKALLSKDKWQSFDIAPVESSHGWTASPSARTLFEFIPCEGILTVGEALIMAQKGYGYFAIENTNDNHSLFAYDVAQENGYLPKGFLDKVEQPILAQDYVSLLKLACKGRNNMPISAKSLQAHQEENGTITRANAISFALQLEQLATGSVATKKVADTPKGS